MNSSAIILTCLAFVLFILIKVWLDKLSTIRALSTQVNLTIGVLIAQLEQRMSMMPDALKAAETAISIQYAFYNKVLDIRKGKDIDISLIDLNNVPFDMLPSVIDSLRGRPHTESQIVIDPSAYEKFMDMLQATETDITAAKRHYASAVAEYNDAINTLLGSIVASAHDYKQVPDFRLTKALLKKPDYWATISVTPPRMLP